MDRVEDDIYINQDLKYEKVLGNELPLFRARKVIETKQHTLLTENLIYIIKLRDTEKRYKVNQDKYLILDLETYGERVKIGSYYGNIQEWFGFFWNETIIYQKSKF